MYRLFRIASNLDRDKLLQTVASMNLESEANNQPIQTVLTMQLCLPFGFELEYLFDVCCLILGCYRDQRGKEGTEERG